MHISTIIFDINGVLFKENKLKLIKKIGVKRLFGYLARYRTNPLNVCLDALQAMYERELPTLSAKEHPIIYKNRTMPDCTAQWQRGQITSQELMHQLDEHLNALAANEHFASLQEYKLIHHIMHTVLAADLATISKPMRKTIRLVKKLRKRNKHSLFILSNMGQEPFDLLKKRHSPILELFDDAIISAHVGLIKPEPTIYEYLLHKHSLQPTECIFIDDQKENIIAAQELGIHAIQFDTASRVRRKLQRLGVL